MNERERKRLLAIVRIEKAARDMRYALEFAPSWPARDAAMKELHEAFDDLVDTVVVEPMCRSCQGHGRLLGYKCRPCDGKGFVAIPETWKHHGVPTQ